MSEQGYLMAEAKPPAETPPPALDGYLPQPAKEPPVRVVWGNAGRPTAAVVRDPKIILDTTLYYIEVESIAEAWYLAGIINSNACYVAVEPFMAKGQWGPRQLNKQLWRLPIPEFDADNPLHAELAAAGATCARSVRRLRSRREVRAWMADAPQQQRVESLVSQLLTAEEE